MIVRAALLNPLNLDWQRFLVAEESGGLIAVGQVKPHRDGSRELASIAVVPEWLGVGVGAAIVRGLVARESGALHLMCAARTAPFYERLGFRTIERAEMPPYFRRIARLSGAAEWLARSDAMRLAIMRRDPEWSAAGAAG